MIRRNARLVETEHGRDHLVHHGSQSDEPRLWPTDRQQLGSRRRNRRRRCNGGVALQTVQHAPRIECRCRHFGNTDSEDCGTGDVARDHGAESGGGCLPRHRQHAAQRECVSDQRATARRRESGVEPRPPVDHRHARAVLSARQCPRIERRIGGRVGTLSAFAKQNRERREHDHELRRVTAEHLQQRLRAANFGPHHRRNLCVVAVCQERELHRDRAMQNAARGTPAGCSAIGSEALHRIGVSDIE